MIENYSRVQLLTDQYHTEGASKGDVGSVIEVYQNGDYEVEFADENGIDFAQIVAREEDLQAVNAEPPTVKPFGDNIVVDIQEVSMSPVASKRKRLSSHK